MPSEKRVVAYIDGFNLYHALGDLGEDHLKWLDLRALAETFAPRPDHQLIHVFYCTAYAHWRPESCARHEIYIKALAARQVTPLLGRFKARDRQCRKCGARWIDHEEKESDVSLGIALVLGAADDRFDRALLFTRDSDPRRPPQLPPPVAGSTSSTRPPTGRTAPLPPWAIRAEVNTWVTEIAWGGIHPCCTMRNNTSSKLMSSSLTAAPLSMCGQFNLRQGARAPIGSALAFGFGSLFVGHDLQAGGRDNYGGGRHGKHVIACGTNAGAACR